MWSHLKIFISSTKINIISTVRRLTIEMRPHVHLFILSTKINIISIVRQQTIEMRHHGQLINQHKIGVRKSFPSQSSADGRLR
jgi:hypothetical protein